MSQQDVRDVNRIDQWFTAWRFPAPSTHCRLFGAVELWPLAVSVEAYDYYEGGSGLLRSTVRKKSGRARVRLVPGLEHLLCSHILGIIIPTD